jgi:hypothetical protein
MLDGRGHLLFSGQWVNSHHNQLFWVTFLQRSSLYSYGKILFPVVACYIDLALYLYLYLWCFCNVPTLAGVQGVA